MANFEKVEAILGTFIVFAPDCEGAVDLRLAVRPEHLVGLKANIERGWTSKCCILLRFLEARRAESCEEVGGIMTTEESRVAGTNIMIGSTFICKAKSLGEVWDVVKSDPYWTKGVVSVVRLLYPLFGNSERECGAVGEREGAGSAVDTRHRYSRVKRVSGKNQTRSG